MTGGRKNLIGLSRDELAAELTAIGEKPFRAKQLWHWIYYRGESDFSRMTTLSKLARPKLAGLFSADRPGISRQETSRDKSRKWLLRFEDGNEAECVYIPETDRGALCISSQVGCTLNCPFCYTSTQKLVRNLSAGEIVSQMMVARDSYGEWPSPKGGERKLSNIVMMGMGEPLYNFDNVAKALKIIMDPEGISISRFQTGPIVLHSGECR